MITGRDVADEQGGLPNARPITPDQVTPNHPPIAVDRATFAGEIVAVVVARSAAAARDAAELVDVDYDELPAALDLKEAAADTVLAHPDLGTNKSAFWKFDSAEAGTGGNVDEAIAKARGDGIVIEREYRQQRLIPAFMEPRSTVVDPTGEQIDVVGHPDPAHPAVPAGRGHRRVRVQDPGGRPRRRRRVRRQAPDDAGGVHHLPAGPQAGQAGQVHRDPLRVPDGRAPRSRPVAKLTLAAEKDGTVTGFKVELLADLGSHVSLVGGGVPVLGAFMFNSIYKFPAYQFSVQTVLTNKTWTDAYRGAGRPRRRTPSSGSWTSSPPSSASTPRDPLEELDHARGVPFTTVAGSSTTGNYEAATARAKEMLGTTSCGPSRSGAATRGHRPARHRGPRSPRCGLAPSRVLGSLDYGAGGWEHASVRMLPTGKVEVVGQRARAGPRDGVQPDRADRLGVAFEDVEVLHGDTQVAHKGLDTYGSRSLVVGGEALVKAVDKVIEKAKVIAAHLLEASADDVEFGGGRFSVRGTDQGLAMGEIALATFAAHNLPDGVEASLDSDATFDPVNFNYPHGTHLCAMETPRPGR